WRSLWKHPLSPSWAPPERLEEKSHARQGTAHLAGLGSTLQQGAKKRKRGAVAAAGHILLSPPQLLQPHLGAGPQKNFSHVTAQSLKDAYGIYSRQMLKSSSCFPISSSRPVLRLCLLSMQEASPKYHSLQGSTESQNKVTKLGRAIGEKIAEMGLPKNGEAPAPAVGPLQPWLSADKEISISWG
ncbi:hypothetical protein Nmel_017047, partial [Mimus melanotis]